MHSAPLTILFCKWTLQIWLHSLIALYLGKTRGPLFLNQLWSEGKQGLSYALFSIQEHFNSGNVTAFHDLTFGQMTACINSEETSRFLNASLVYLSCSCCFQVTSSTRTSSTTWAWGSRSHPRTTSCRRPSEPICTAMLCLVSSRNFLNNKIDGGSLNQDIWQENLTSL